ncbi:MULTISPECIES: helix-turn-helix domain-containing protein [unclassified Streptomyces]|uniref:helix-turn-helix domain-containing protein n=1 Tax=unclassified Streptomyces TaxID=2593676 RepID=UPI00403D515D
MSVREAAAYLGVSVSWVYKNVTRLGIPVYRFGDGSNAKIRFKRSEVDEWVKQQRMRL